MPWVQSQQISAHSNFGELWNLPRLKQRPGPGCAKKKMAGKISAPMRNLPHEIFHCRTPCVTFRRVVFLCGALDSHPFFPSHVASGRCVLTAAAAGAPAGVVSAFAEPRLGSAPPITHAAQKQRFKPVFKPTCRRQWRVSLSEASCHWRADCHEAQHSSLGPQAVARGVRTGQPAAQIAHSVHQLLTRMVDGVDRRTGQTVFVAEPVLVIGLRPGVVRVEQQNVVAVGAFGARPPAEGLAGLPQLQRRRQGAQSARAERQRHAHSVPLSSLDFETIEAFDRSLSPAEGTAASHPLHCVVSGACDTASLTNNPSARPIIPYQGGVDIVRGGGCPLPPPMTITITIYPFD